MKDDSDHCSPVALSELSPSKASRILSQTAVAGIDESLTETGTIELIPTDISLEMVARDLMRADLESLSALVAIIIIGIFL